MDTGRIVTVSMEDHTSMGLTIFEGSGEKNAPVTICFPAMGVAASYYEPVARALQSEGMTVVTADLRGLGLSSERASRKTTFGYHEMVTYDYQAIVEKVAEEFPGRPLFLMGHSLGGQIACLFAAARPGLVCGLILVAVCSVHFRQWPFPTRYGVLGFVQFVRLLSLVMGYFPGHWFNFGGRESRGEIRDWAHQSLTGRYETKNGDRDYEALLSAMELPILSISFTDDGFCPMQPVQHLLEKMPCSVSSHLVLGPHDWGTQKVGHFGWVKRPKVLVSHITAWLGRIGARPLER